eukprot:jgi/Galph1/6068/GphlegSOOS_G4671.1
MSFLPGSVINHKARVAFRKIKEVMTGRTAESIESDISYIVLMKRVNSLSAVTNELEKFLEEELRQKTSLWMQLERCWEAIEQATDELVRIDKHIYGEIDVIPTFEGLQVKTEHFLEDESVEEFAEDDFMIEETYMNSGVLSYVQSEDVKSRTYYPKRKSFRQPDSSVAKSRITSEVSCNKNHSPNYAKSSFSISASLVNENIVTSEMASTVQSSNQQMKDRPGNVEKDLFSGTNTHKWNRNPIYLDDDFQLLTSQAVSSLRRAHANMFSIVHSYSAKDPRKNNQNFNDSDQYLSRRSQAKPVKNPHLYLDSTERRTATTPDMEALKEASLPPSYEEAIKNSVEADLSSNTSVSSSFEKLYIQNHSQTEIDDNFSELETFPKLFSSLPFDEFSVKNTKSSLLVCSRTERILIFLRQLRQVFYHLKVLHKKRENSRLRWEDREYRWKKFSVRLQNKVSQNELNRGKRWEEKARKAKEELEYATKKIYSIVEKIENSYATVFVFALSEIFGIYLNMSGALENVFSELQETLKKRIDIPTTMMTNFVEEYDKVATVDRTQELVLSRHSSAPEIADDSKTDASFYRSVSPIVSPRGLEFDASSGHKRAPNLSSLPEEILAKIFKHLTISQKAAVSQVCKTFHSACCRGELWRTVTLQSRFPSDLEPGAKLATATLLESFFRLHGADIYRIEYFYACSRFAGKVPLQLVARYCMNLEELILNDTPPGSVNDELLQDIFSKAGSHLRAVELNYCTAVTDSSLKSLAAFCENLERFILRREPMLTDCKEPASDVTIRGLQAIVAHCERLKEICAPTLLCESILSFVAQRASSLISITVEDPPIYNCQISGIETERLSNQPGNSLRKDSTIYKGPSKETWNNLREKLPYLRFTLSLEIDLSGNVHVMDSRLDRNRKQSSSWSCEHFVEVFGDKSTAISELQIYFAGSIEHATFRNLGKLFLCIGSAFHKLESLKLENVDVDLSDGVPDSTLEEIDEGLLEIITNCPSLKQVSFVNFPMSSYVLFYLFKVRGVQLTSLSLGLRDIQERIGIANSIW